MCKVLVVVSKQSNLLWATSENYGRWTSELRRDKLSAITLPRQLRLNDFAATTLLQQFCRNDFAATTLRREYCIADLCCVNPKARLWPTNFETVLRTVHFGESALVIVADHVSEAFSSANFSRWTLPCCEKFTNNGYTLRHALWHAILAANVCRELVFCELYNADFSAELLTMYLRMRHAAEISMCNAYNQS